MESKVKFLSIDIGGTKIEICKFDKNYRLLSSFKVATNTFPVYSIKFLKSIENLLFKNLERGIKRIGVSFNCVVKNGRIIYSSILGGRANYDLEKIFSQKFKIPVYLRNDVNAMALSELKFGAGRKADSFVLINLGTGIRISYVYKGMLIEGFGGNAGELSQQKIILSEFPKKLFLLDNVISGKGISEIYYRFTNNKYDAKIIFSLNDIWARKTINIFRRSFSQLLENVSYYYNPEKIILNGSLAKASSRFLPQVVKEYKREVNSIFHFKDISVSKLRHAACLGAVIE